MSIATISTYVKNHERLILAGIAGLLLWFAVGRIENILSKHDAANLQQAQVVAQSQADKTSALAEQATQQATQYKALAAQVAAQNAALEQANVALSQALIKQQHTDATLPPTELAKRWNTLVPQANATVTATGVQVPETGAVATVQQLEEVHVLNVQLKAAEEVAQNDEQLIRAGVQQVATLNSEVGSLNLQLKDNQVVCSQQLGVQRDAYEKKLRHRTLWAFVAGFVTRQLLTKGL